MCPCLCVQYWKTKQNKTGDQASTVLLETNEEWNDSEILGAVPLKYWLLEDTATEYPQPVSAWLEQNDNLPKKAHSKGLSHYNHWKGDCFSVFRSFPSPPNSQLCVGNSLLPLSTKLDLDGFPVWTKLARPHWDVDQLLMQKTPVPSLICGSWSWPPHCSPCSHEESVPWNKAPGVSTIRDSTLQLGETTKLVSRNTFHFKRTTLIRSLRAASYLSSGCFSSLAAASATELKSGSP